MTLFDDLPDDCIYEIGRWIEYRDDLDNLFNIIETNRRKQLKNKINTYIFGVFGIENLELCEHLDHIEVCEHLEKGFNENNEIKINRLNYLYFNNDYKSVYDEIEIGHKSRNGHHNKL